MTCVQKILAADLPMMPRDASIFTDDDKGTIDKAVSHLIRQLGSNVANHISRTHHFSVSIRFDDWREVEAFATPAELRKTRTLRKEIAALHHPDGFVHEFDPAKQV